MDLKRDIKPITYLKNRTTDVVAQVSEGRTMVITQNGEAKMVVMGVEEYDRLHRGLALLKMVAQSEADVRAGRLVSQGKVFRELEEIIEDAKREQAGKKSPKTTKRIEGSVDRGRKARR